MEGLIIFIIIAVISSIFGKSNNKQEKPMPPFGGNTNKEKPNTSRSKSFTSLEDFAKEIFQELSGEKEEKTAPANLPQAEPVKAVVEERTTFQFEKAEEVNVKKHVPREEPKVKQPVNVPSYIPTTREAVLQAVITSEIFGPPKAKRR